jgi:hypothetical protein
MRDEHSECGENAGRQGHRQEDPAQPVAAWFLLRRWGHARTVPSQAATWMQAATRSDQVLVAVPAVAVLVVEDVDAVRS